MQNNEIDNIIKEVNKRRASKFVTDIGFFSKKPKTTKSELESSLHQVVDTIKAGFQLIERISQKAEHFERMNEAFDKLIMGNHLDWRFDIQSKDTEYVEKMCEGIKGNQEEYLEIVNSFKHELPEEVMKHLGQVFNQADGLIRKCYQLASGNDKSIREKNNEYDTIKTNLSISLGEQYQQFQTQSNIE